MSLSNGETEENHTGVTPWNEKYQKAHAGDIEAEYSIYMAADPFIERLCNVPYFRNRLGKDEIRSICSFALVKWVRKEQQLPRTRKFPFSYGLFYEKHYFAAYDGRISGRNMNNRQRTLLQILLPKRMNRVTAVLKEKLQTVRKNRKANVCATRFAWQYATQSDSCRKRKKK